jgi:outer membrane receptor protein involved in Fe transport
VAGPTSSVQGGAAASFYNAPDIGRLLEKSDSGLGVQNQFRGAIIADPRIRGYHLGQITTYGDGGYFVPARVDLDTIVSKFDPTLVRDVIVIKGPYSVHYGPGFSFLDIVTFDSPRSKEPCTYEFHERTLFGYNTNGQGLHALQSVEYGAPDWGVRFSYDFRVANDYFAGGGVDVPSSYNSQNFQGVAGFNLNENTKLEFKVVRLYQHDVEFPGLYFDINRLDTEAYSLRFNSYDPNTMHRLTADFWFNFTGASGDTHQGAKQATNNLVINSAFMTPDTTVQDHSNTNFSEMSRGYRLGWNLGEKGTPQIGLGTDLNIVSQRLEEHIRLFTAPDFNVFGFPLGPGVLAQDPGIPVSRSDDIGFYLDGSLPVGQRLLFNAGARVDYVRTSSDPRLIPSNFSIFPGSNIAVFTPGVVNGSSANVTPGQTTLDPIIFSVDPNDENLVRHFTLWSAYLSGDYKIDEHLSAQMSFGHAERPPTLTELYSTGPFVAVLQQGLNRLIGDPHLKPERLNQFDIGFKGRWDKVRLGVNGFYSWIQDYITFDQNKALGSAINQVVFTNTDLATLAGGEAYVEVDVGDWVTPFGTASYVQGRDLTHIDARRDPTLVSSRRVSNLVFPTDTEALPGISPLELRAGLRVHEPGKQPRWSVELSARSVFGQHSVATSLNEIDTPGFTVFDLRGYWQVNKNLLVVSGVENIGDKYYNEHLDPLTPAPLANPVLFRPGVNYYLTVQVTY